MILKELLYYSHYFHYYFLPRMRLPRYRSQSQGFLTQLLSLSWIWQLKHLRCFFFLIFYDLNEPIGNQEHSSLILEYGLRVHLKQLFISPSLYPFIYSEVFMRCLWCNWPCSGFLFLVWDTYLWPGSLEICTNTPAIYLHSWCDTFDKALNICS